VLQFIATILPYDKSGQQTYSGIIGRVPEVFYLLGQPLEVNGCFGGIFRVNLQG
jgi:hypothetical protein